MKSEKNGFEDFNAKSDLRYWRENIYNISKCFAGRIQVLRGLHAA